MMVAMPDTFGARGGRVRYAGRADVPRQRLGVPYAAVMVGAKLVLPGPRLDPVSLHGLITPGGRHDDGRRPDRLDGAARLGPARQRSLGPLRKVGIGGSACPPVMIERFAALGVDVVHAWGMTEASPVALASRPKRQHHALAADERQALCCKQGRPLLGLEAKVVGADGEEVPHDGVAFGRLLIRGPTVAAGYFRIDRDENFAEPGWFDTGDVATLDADGFVEIVDRTKDVIKSGGEWIGSIELENIAVSHPAVREAAVVARPDPKWGERPVLFVVLQPGASLTPEEAADFYAGKVARWAVPQRPSHCREPAPYGDGQALEDRDQEDGVKPSRHPVGAAES